MKARAGKSERARKPNALNLTEVEVLIVEQSAVSSELLLQILRGFRVRKITQVASAEEGKVACAATDFDLVFCDGELDQGDGLSFTKWLRTVALPPNATTPVIMLFAHTSEANIAHARDSGAHYVIAKPATPGVLLARIEWIVRKSRPFVETETYTGPDRRFKARFPHPGRRASDGEEPEQAGAALSQDGVDALFG